MPDATVDRTGELVPEGPSSNGGRAEEGCRLAEVKATGCGEGKVFDGCPQDGPSGAA